MNFTLIITPEKEGGFTVEVAELPECVTYGETLQHAYEMAKEAIQAYLESI